MIHVHFLVFDILVCIERSGTLVEEEAYLHRRRRCCGTFHMKDGACACACACVATEEILA